MNRKGNRNLLRKALYSKVLSSFFSIVNKDFNFFTFVILQAYYTINACGKIVVIFLPHSYNYSDFYIQYNLDH
jgi:hypothetical protein